MSNHSTKDVIFKSVDVLNSGGIIIYPTETCYGVGVDATNSKAVTKLLKYKKRVVGKPIPVAVYNKKTAQKYVYINNEASKIYDTFLPGPITIISKSKGKVDPRLESEIGTLGVRIPNYSLVLEILKTFGKPITATSASNVYGRTPYSIEDILENLNERKKSYVDLIIDVGVLPKNPPSTVIDTTTFELTVRREGRINPVNAKIGNYISYSVEETTQIAQKVTSQMISENSEYYLLLLDGEMGAGKTHFVKGIGTALGVTQTIKSPSYTYINEYATKLNSIMYHIDAWRIQTKEDLALLDIDKFLSKKNFVVIEWPSVIASLDDTFLSKYNYTWVELVVVNETTRQIRIIKS